MKTWIICYLGMVVVCFIGNLIVENTKFADFSSKILNLILAASMVVPIILAVTGIKNGTVILKDALSVDETFVSVMNSYKINLVYYELVEQLEKLGVANADISFQSLQEEGNIVITKVYVNLSDSEYDERKLNIDLIKNAVANTCNVGEESVEIYE